jgi:predicted CoA-binding protein
MSWETNIIEDSAGIRDLLAATRTIAVLGIKTEAQANQAAFYVPSYMANAGYEVIPVPVYFPDVKEILGKPVYRKLADIPGEVDLVNVFRRPDDIPQHVDDILAKKPKAVWLQLGIRHDAVAEQLAKAGIKVVQNRCLMVDHRSLA